MRNNNDNDSWEIKEIEILQHTVEYWYENDYNPKETLELEAEHIEEMIKEGYNQGELNALDMEDDSTHSGWWRIKKEVQ